MSLSDEGANALRECIRILAPYYDARMRQRMVEHIEDCIKQGIVPAWSCDDIVRLFYPNDPAATSKLCKAMEQAHLSGELVGILDLPPERFSACGRRFLTMPACSRVWCARYSAALQSQRIDVGSRRA
ncbi:MAG: hypothetical protein GEV05_06915 [Betaproteobacteria bacterium]|nr:hypothetical protein [Betaproteobacteria bacterium]